MTKAHNDSGQSGHKPPKPAGSLAARGCRSSQTYFRDVFEPVTTFGAVLGSAVVLSLLMPPPL